MFSELEAVLVDLVWRLTWAAVLLVLRVLWLPILVIAGIYFFVIPAVATASQLAAEHIDAIVIAALLFLVWVRRR